MSTAINAAHSYDYATDHPAAPSGAAPHEHRRLKVYCAGCGRRYTAVLRCQDRTCTDCRRKQYFALVKGYVSILKQLVDSPTDLRLMTLTVKNIPISSSAYIRSEISNIMRYFNRLRKRKYYLNVISGGIRGVELVCKDGESWNLHLHILYQGEYIPVCCNSMRKANTRWAISDMENKVCPKCTKKLCLRRDWLRYTKSSPVVDVRKAWGVKGGLKYILKYLTKPPIISGYTDSYNRIMKGIRYVQTFGTWFDVKMVKDPYVCPHCGSIQWISEFQIDLFSMIASKIEMEADPVIDYDKVIRFPSRPISQSLNIQPLNYSLPFDIPVKNA